jgi:hypothetical protein
VAYVPYFALAKLTTADETRIGALVEESGE